MALGVVDYVVFGIMLIMSASIGVYYRFTGGKQKTTQVIIFIHNVKLQSMVLIFNFVEYTVFLSSRYNYNTEPNAYMFQLIFDKPFFHDKNISTGGPHGNFVHNGQTRNIQIIILKS